MQIALARTSSPLRSSFASLAIALAVVCGGCRVQLIAPYDGLTDRGTTELQRRVETLLVKLERAAQTPDPGDGAYAAYGAEYDAIEVDLRLLETHAASIEENGITVKQLANVHTMLADLQALHRRKSEKAPPEEFSKDAIQLVRVPCEIAIRAILTLEREKVRASE